MKNKKIKKELLNIKYDITDVINVVDNRIPSKLYTLLKDNNRMLTLLTEARDQSIMQEKEDSFQLVVKILCNIIDVRIREIGPISNERKQVTAWQQIEFLKGLQTEIKSLDYVQANHYGFKF